MRPNATWRAERPGPGVDLLLNGAVGASVVLTTAVWVIMAGRLLFTSAPPVPSVAGLRPPVMSGSQEDLLPSAGAPPRPPRSASPPVLVSDRRRPGGSHAVPPTTPRSVRAVQDAHFRLSVTLLLLTLALPGSAQVVRGRRRTGWLALGVWATLIVGALGTVLVGGRAALAAFAVRPALLLGIRVGAALAAVAWALLLLDACRLGRPASLRRGHRVAVAGAALGLVVAVTAPLLLLSHVAGVQANLVSSLFPGGPAASASAGRLNILLLGGDAGADRTGTRTDSMNLVSVDARTGRTVLVGMPRNLEHARFPAGTRLAAAFPDGFSGPGDSSNWLLNAVYGYTAAHPELVPSARNPGAEGVKEAVAGTLGLTVHYYVLVDLAGFRKVVDALGGIHLTVREAVPYGRSGGVLHPGPQEMNGREALWYARSRTGSGDYVRMHRQRCVLGAMLAQAQPANVLRRFGALVDSTKGVVSTDVPRAALPHLVDLAVKARSHGVRSLQMTPPLVRPADPDLAVMRRALASVFPGHRVRAAAAASPTAPSAEASPTAASHAGGDALGDTRGSGGESSVCSLG